MSQYFPMPCEPFGGDVNVTVGLSNYATKDDIKNYSCRYFKLCIKNKFG